MRAELTGLPIHSLPRTCAAHAGRADSELLAAGSHTGTCIARDDIATATAQQEPFGDALLLADADGAGGELLASNGLPLALRRGQRTKRPNTLLAQDASERESDGKRLRTARGGRSGWASDGGDSDGGPVSSNEAPVSLRSKVAACFCWRSPHGASACLCVYTRD